MGKMGREGGEREGQGMEERELDGRKEEWKRRTFRQPGASWT